MSFILEEILIVIAIVIGVSLALGALAAAIRFVLVKIAKRNGYTADEMPMHYHVFAFGTYFTILFMIWFITSVT